MYVLSAEQLRQVDRLCAERFGVPSIVLMENAALGVATVIRDQLAGVSDPCVLIFCGPGNNGGDGFALARHLHNDGFAVSIVSVKSVDDCAGDAGVNARIARAMGVPIFAAGSVPGDAAQAARRELGDPDLVVDALLGTGLDRPPTGALAELIGCINAYREEQVAILAIDIPSGLLADAGEAAGAAAVRADVTVSLVGLKPGFLTLTAQAYLGECLIAGIGAPRELIESLGRPMDVVAGGGRDHPGRGGRGSGSIGEGGGGRHGRLGDDAPGSEDGPGTPRPPKRPG